MGGGERGPRRWQPTEAAGDCGNPEKTTKDTKEHEGERKVVEIPSCTFVSFVVNALRWRAKRYVLIFRPISLLSLSNVLFSAAGLITNSPCIRHRREVTQFCYSEPLEGARTHEKRQ
jgi:hypothetical protein